MSAQSARAPDTPLSTQTLLVHAYVDGELDVTTAIGIKDRIAANPNLNAESDNVVALKHALLEKVNPETASQAFRARIESAVGISRRRNAPSWRALAASVVLAMVVSSASTWLAVNNLNDGVLEQVIDSHTRAMITARPTDVVSSDQHIVKPWFNDKLTSAPVVIDLRNDGYPLAGARIDVIGAKPVATLVYNRRLHTISLFAQPGSGSMPPLLAHRAFQGLNVVSWNQDGTDYWAVSDLNSKELATFADLIRNASRQ